MPIERLHSSVLIRRIFLLLLTGIPFSAHAQEELSSLREKWIGTGQDSITLDTFSIVPGTFSIFTARDQPYPQERYELRPFNALLILKGTSSSPDSLKVRYRVFPIDMSLPRSHKDRERIQPQRGEQIEPYTYRADQRGGNERGFDFGGLDRSGNISRGLNFGNTQDLSVNSNLNLELSGALSEEVNVEASVTDDNIPVQPEGNTQQLQDFDKVFVRFFNEDHRLTAGDARIQKKDGHYLLYSKRIKGADMNSRFFLGDEGEEEGGIMEMKASGAISKGKFARNVIRGVEGNQGPYRLRGAENERFIIVLAGTERVYIDGELLERGTDNDYTIDYNSAELTFTPDHLINKETRIRVEFQYSEQNYARSLFRTSTRYEKDGIEMALDIYSEQDAKGQTLQQDLTEEDKERLRKAGDDPSKAVVPRIEKMAEYANDEVRYRMTDSLGYDSVFVHSSDPEEAFFRLNFSEVGQGNGDYVRASFTPNGRAFRWVPPDTVNGEIVRQGDHAPVIPLKPPEQRRMVTYSADIEVGERSSLRLESAVSDRDQNRFSSIDNADNTGGAVLLGFSQKVPLESEEDSAWHLSSDLEWEHVQKDFEPIERIRNVEFARDWNLPQGGFQESRQLGNARIGFEKIGVGKSGYRFQHIYSGKEFMEGRSYKGDKHGIYSDMRHKGFLMDFDGSLLRTRGNGRSRFLRHKGKFEKHFPFIVLGYKDEHENNRRYLQGGLRDDSYAFYDWEAYAGNPDTAGNEYRLYYGKRRDHYGNEERLDRGTSIEEYGLSFHLKQNPSHRLKGRVGHRRLNVLAEELVSERDDRTLVNRLEHNVRMLDNVIEASTFYQLGSGTERKKEFIYLQVPAGQGSYTWNDYNDNGVKELEEFEQARYSDQARYIRSFIRGDEYVQTFSNQFQHSLNFRPSRVWGSDEGIKGFLSRFSDQVAYQVDRKTSGSTPPDIAYDPFKQDLPDTTLLSLNSSFRNSVFFNRSDPIYGFEHTYRDNRDRSLLASGFQERLRWSHEFRGRWDFLREWGVECKGGWGAEKNRSDILDGRNYRIGEESVSPRIRYQPSTTFRIGMEAGYTEKKNAERLGGERAILRDITGDLKFNAASKGSFRLELRYIDVRYNGPTKNSLAFRMLESLEDGENLTWTLSFRRNLSDNLQMDLSYNGRASEAENTIHNGGVQVRAFF